jgi:hypothetical protein
MSNLKDQNCPLCEQKATFNFGNFALDKYFNCPTCTQYIISTMAEEKLKSLSSSVRENLSKMAKNSPELHALLIRLKGTEIESIYITRLEANHQ